MNFALIEMLTHLKRALTWTFDQNYSGKNKSKPMKIEKIGSVGKMGKKGKQWNILNLVKGNMRNIQHIIFNLYDCFYGFSYLLKSRLEQLKLM